MACSGTVSVPRVLKRFLEFAMQQEELKRYKEEVESEFGKCRVLTAKVDTTLTNCNDTSDRKAPKGISWIDYWRSMTGCYDTRLTCCSCGKVIYAGKVPDVMVNMYRETGDDASRHKAIGGHMYVEESETGKYPGGRYIAPLCPECNTRRGVTLPIQKGTKICKEVGAETTTD